MFSASKVKEVAKKNSHILKSAMATTKDAPVNLLTTPSPESIMALTHQVELEELHLIIASQQKKLNDARLHEQQSSTPTTRESTQSESTTGLAFSALLIIDQDRIIDSPQHDTSSLSFPPSSPSPQRHKQPLAPRLAVLGGAIIDEAL